MNVIPPPPTTVRRQDDGCWKWGLIGCGGLGCVVVIAAVVLFWGVMRSPMVKQAMSSVFQAQAATQQIKTVGTALDRYVADNKKYPKELKELIPKYLPDERSLHISPDAGSPRIWYKKPAMDAPGETIVLQTEITPPIAMPDAPPWAIKLRKDGKLGDSDYTYTDKYGNTQRVPIGQP